MERIIAGQFHTKNEADIVAASIAQFVDTGDYCVSSNAAPAGAAEQARPDGFMLSVRIGSPKSERVVLAALRKGRAADIEQAEGTWRDGAWADYNPLAAPQLVKGAIN